MVGLIIFAFFFIIICTVIILWFHECTKKRDYNGVLWVHPEKGGGLIGIKRDPELQKPFLFNYSRWQFGLSMFRKHLYMWMEDEPITKPDPKNKDKTIKEYPIKHWEPTVAADFGLVTMKNKDNEIVIDDSKPYITPNELFDTTDWECLRDLETAKSPIKEAIQLGMAVLMVGICVFGILATVDMIGKKQPVPPAPAAISQVIIKGDYGL